MSVATSTAISLATIAATSGASIYGATKTSNANKDAAKFQTEGANKAAEIQAKSQAEALAFQKEQAARDEQRAETTQRSNYDQWAARQGYQSTIGSMLGLPSRNIPSYQSSLPSGAPQGMPQAGGGDPKLQAAIATYQQANPGKVAIEPLTAALKQQGFNVDRFKYDGGVLSNNELNVGGQKYKVLGGEGGPGAYWYTPGTDDSAPGAGPAGGGYVSPMSALIAPPQSYMRRPVTAALRMPGNY